MLVTEYLARGDLWHALQRLHPEGGAGIFAWNRWGRRIALDIARGLCFLHGLGIVHFDLVPAPCWQWQPLDLHSLQRSGACADHALPRLVLCCACQASLLCNSKHKQKLLHTEV